MTPPDDRPVALQRESSSEQSLRPIDIAFADYDRTRPLIDGRVKAKGIELRAVNQWVGDFCVRPVYEEYDAAEMSFSWYLQAADRGDPCVAIPIFPLRDPLLAFVYTRADAPYTKPADLIGKRIGSDTYRMTINLLLRGIFKDHYGLAPEQASWVTSGPEGNGFVLPAGVKLDMRPGKATPQKLRDGDVNAIFCPRVPQEFKDGAPWIRRLFPDCQAEVHRLVRRLGYVPVSHTIVIKTEIARREPWVAASLYEAFVAAQKCADECAQIEKCVSYVVGREESLGANFQAV